jgi:hypothetical protein
VQILIDKEYLKLPYNHVKRTKIDKIDYPLITLAAIKNKNNISAGISAFYNHPFLLPNNLLNENIPEVNRVENIILAVRNDVISDLSGSKEYRIFVLRNILNQMYNNFKEV